MLTERFLMGRTRHELTGLETEALENAISEVKSIGSRKVIARHGVPLATSTLLVEGFVCRYMDDRQGHRQLVAVHVPGDFVDLHAFPLKHLDHDVATIGPARIATFDHAALTRITEQHPHLTRKLWFSTLLDAAMHREWIFRLGRLGADGRLAHFFCEVNLRLEMVGLAKDGRFDLPFIQTDLAEACGVTGVHINRTLRALRERDMMIFRDGVVQIGDLRALSRLAEFDPAYLYRDVE